MEAQVKVHGDRDALGRFRAKLERACYEALDEMGRDGARRAAELAPGPSAKQDPRNQGRHLQDSIYHEVVGNTVTWGSDLRHAGFIEKGGEPSEIPGEVSFYWEKRARWWSPGDNVIHHPATAAKPYLRPSWDEITANYRDYVRRHLGS
jgi:hypothetical protein